LRRDRSSDTAAWIYLPAVGRVGDSPDWPLAVSRGKAIAAREALVWEREWHRPQAVMWEQVGLEVEVALFVRALVHAERPRSKMVTAGDRTLVRQLMDDLGISVAGLRSHHWVIAADEEPRPQAARDVDATSARDRLRLVVGE
jgi:hypothetical protein